MRIPAGVPVVLLLATASVVHAQPGPSQTSISVAVQPSGMDASVFVPVWASLTVKPACTVGVQLLASYDVHPTASSDTGATIAAGLLWQPSNACSDAPGVRIR